MCMESMCNRYWCAWNPCATGVDVHGIYAEQVLMCMESMCSRHWCPWNLCGAGIDVHGIYVQQALIFMESAQHALICMKSMYAQQALMWMESMCSRHWCAWNLCTAGIDVHGIYAQQALMYIESCAADIDHWCAWNLGIGQATDMKIITGESGKKGIHISIRIRASVHIG